MSLNILSAWVQFSETSHTGHFFHILYSVFLWSLFPHSILTMPLEALLHIQAVFHPCHAVVSPEDPILLPPFSTLSYTDPLCTTRNALNVGLFYFSISSWPKCILFPFQNSNSFLYVTNYSFPLKTVCMLLVAMCTTVQTQLKKSNFFPPQKPGQHKCVKQSVSWHLPIHVQIVHTNRCVMSISSQAANPTSLWKKKNPHKNPGFRFQAVFTVGVLTADTAVVVPVSHFFPCVT